ncbi:MAG TPA: DedA family protein [Balneolales bacterium]|nr:DedA family protein [Balneolales bacterium]
MFCKSRLSDFTNRHRFAIVLILLVFAVVGTTMAVGNNTAADSTTFWTHLQYYLQTYGYWALFFVIFLEDFGLPLPGETMLLASSYMAAAGKMHTIDIFVIAVLAAILGDNLGYFIGLKGGRKFLTKYGHYIFLDQERLHHLDDFFSRHGASIIIPARFIDGLRQVNGLLAGMSRLPWHKFVIYNVLGAILWVGGWMALIRILYTQASQYLGVVKNIQTYLFVLLVLLIVGAVGRLIYRHYFPSDDHPEKAAEEHS